MKRGTRFIINSAVASMGYGLPAAIGLCLAAEGKETICLEGDGSIMMNLQELQTVVTSKLPIKIFLINNEGYHSIRQTQNNLFGGHSKVGIGPESHDLSFPSYKKIAEAFGYPYFEAHSNAQMKEAVRNALSTESFAFCEILPIRNRFGNRKAAPNASPTGGWSVRLWRILRLFWREKSSLKIYILLP